MQVAANDVSYVAAMIAKQAAAIQNVMSQGSGDSSGGQEKAEGGPPPPPGKMMAAVAYSGSGASAGSIFAAAVMTSAPAAPPPPPAAEEADAPPSVAETAARAAKNAERAASEAATAIEAAQARATKYTDWVGQWNTKLEEAGIDPATNKPVGAAAAPAVGFAGYMMTTGEDGSTTVVAAISTAGGGDTDIPLTDEQQMLVDKAMQARETTARVTERTNMQIEAAQARADKYAYFADKWAEKAGLPLPSAATTAVEDAEVIEETPAVAETVTATEEAAEAAYTPAASTAATSSSAVNDFFAFLSQMHEDQGLEYEGTVYTSTDGAEFTPVTTASVETAEIAETVAPAEVEVATPEVVTTTQAATVETGNLTSGLPQFGSFEALFAPLFEFMNAFQQAFSGFQQRAA